MRNIYSMTQNTEYKKLFSPTLVQEIEKENLNLMKLSQDRQDL